MKENNDRGNTNWVVVYLNPEGPPDDFGPNYEVFGPFESREDAEQWISVKRHLWFRDGQLFVTTIRKPNQMTD